MQKIKTRYVCQNCGYTSPRWMGKCPSCKEWDTMTEEISGTSRYETGTQNTNLADSRMYTLNEVDITDSERIVTGVKEFDRLLGGGVMYGSTILLGGTPGIGKSTLLLQLSAKMAKGKDSVLYVTGEESIQQTKMRAQRLNVQADSLFLLNETSIEKIKKHIQKLKPKAVIIDSIQIMYLSILSSAPGSVSQVRECTAHLNELCKRENIILFLVGHVTKSGAIAGPRVIEHIVDTVLYFEGETRNNFRILRSIKNRFGSTDEIGIFNMKAGGLCEVRNPSDIFLPNKTGVNSTGSVIVAALEGSRPILVELQALVSPTAYGIPERRTTGLNHKRLAVLIAVLEKRAGLNLSNQDVFVNIAGGVKLLEPAVDLGAVLAIVSSFREIEIKAGTVVVGEVGLGGEVRSVKDSGRRVAEVNRLGFKRIVLPQANMQEIPKNSGLKAIGVNTISEAIGSVFGNYH